MPFDLFHLIVSNRALCDLTVYFYFQNLRLIIFISKWKYVIKTWIHVLLSFVMCILHFSKGMYSTCLAHFCFCFNPVHRNSLLKYRIRELMRMCRFWHLLVSSPLVEIDSVEGGCPCKEYLVSLFLWILLGYLPVYDRYEVPSPQSPGGYITYCLLSKPTNQWVTCTGILVPVKENVRNNNNYKNNNINNTTKIKIIPMQSSMKLLMVKEEY